jgi:transcriptional regulator with PAS, ATPase and Fis domain
VRRFEPGHALVREGERGDGVFVLIEGRVAIRKPIGPEERHVIAVRGAGDWIGEMALLDDQPRSATATAEGPVSALWIPRDAFLEAVTANAAAASDLLATVVTRLRESDRLLIESLRGKAEALAAQNDALASENRRLHVALDERHGFESFVGSGPASRRVRALARRAAGLRLPVLLLGETGTGKEVIARAIHHGGPRAKGRFVAVNCALVSDTLLESELFGHTRGAFTGAVAAKQGLVEAAHGGTLFLDEIADMPLALQGALLRFLELGEYRQLGETRTRHADVRVIAATHHDLEAAVQGGTFRRDLFYRLDVLRIELPPLRERTEDLPELLAALGARAAERMGASVLEFDRETVSALAAYPFPGNVRELENEIERVYALGIEGRRVLPAALSERVRTREGAVPPTYTEAVRRFKVRLLEKALAEAGGHRARAAERLGLHRSNLVRMLRELDVEGAAGRDER